MHSAGSRRTRSFCFAGSRTTGPLRPAVRPPLQAVAGSPARASINGNDHRNLDKRLGESANQRHSPVTVRTTIAKRSICVMPANQPRLPGWSAGRSPAGAACRRFRRVQRRRLAVKADAFQPVLGARKRAPSDALHSSGFGQLDDIFFSASKRLCWL